MTVLQLADKLHTEGDAYRYLEQLRWGDKAICPHCGSVGEPAQLSSLELGDGCRTLAWYTPSVALRSQRAEQAHGCRAH